MSFPESLPFDRLQPKQRKALLSLLRGSTNQQAAEDADVSTRTIRRWRKLPDFDAALRAARVDFFSACRSQVVATQAEAFESLKRVAHWSYDTRDKVRSAIALMGYLCRPEMAKHIDRQDSKSLYRNKLVEFPLAKRGKSEPEPTETRPSPADSHPFLDDAG